MIFLRDENVMDFVIGVRRDWGGDTAYLIELMRMRVPKAVGQSKK